jgi:GNAT superfamily N-acetyltransferase
MDAVVLTMTEQVSPAEVDEVERQLYAYNIARTGVTDGERVAYALRDATGSVVGLVSGWTWGGCLEIRLLWLRDDWRGQGWGTRLLQAAEATAVARGCTQALLDTHSFQAPQFYQRQGYAIYGTVDDYPPGHQKHYLRKRLSADVPT